MAMLRSVIATARAIRVFGLGTLHQRHIVYSTDPVDEGIAFPSDDLFVTKGKGPVEIPRDQHTVLVIQPDTKQRENMAPMHKLEEAVSLVESISGWDVHETRIDNVRRPNNKHLFGTGKIAELQKVIRKLPISAVFVNTPALTPLQQTTLENMFEKTVFDRFSIVLKIFKERAQTKQAKVQVQLAEIPYLRSRLAQRFRQAGGNQQRGDSGKGEESPLQVQQLDLDKKEQNILQKLNEMRANRLVTRTQRKRVSLPVVALVGYTNAGKTTLAGALSKDESLQPKDMLFATLDTTLHAGLLPCGLKVLYMDTIGFISDLPHELVDSFAATLEEITLADVMVHVRDASHPHAKAHSLNVHKVLTELKLKPDLHTNMIEVLNKCDKIEEQSTTSSEALSVSAKYQHNLYKLKLAIETAVLKATSQQAHRIVIPADGPHLSWLHREAIVVSSAILSHSASHGQQLLEVQAIMTEANHGKFVAKFTSTISSIKSL